MGLFPLDATVVAASGSPNRLFEEAPYPVERYLDLTDANDKPYLDGRQFKVIFGYDPAQLPENFQYGTAQSCVEERWRQMGGRMATKSAGLTFAEYGLDMPYTRCMEEIPWLRRAWDLVFQYKMPVEGETRTERTTGLELWERFCFVGEYRH